MKINTALKCSAILIISFALSLLCSKFSYAQSSGLDFHPSGGKVVDGFINSTNTSFSINFDISDLKPTQTAKLMIADTPLQSYTEPEIELYTMPSSANIRDFFTAGPNIIHVDIFDESGDVSINHLSTTVFADFTAPIGDVNFTTKTGSLKLGVGSQINLTFLPDVTATDIQSVMFNFAGNHLAGVLQDDGSYLARYVIAAKDSSSNNVIFSALVLDEAGNLNDISADTKGLIIDTQSPVVAIQSPENGKTYNTDDIKVNYKVDDSNYTIVLLLNGKEIKIKNGQSITNLADGNYELKLTVTDIAGNKTIAYSKFSIDTTAPDFSAVTNPDGGRIEKGWTIVFDGLTEPGAKVKIEIFSDPLSKETTADATGHYRIEFFAGDLDVGSHDAYITITDQIGNSRNVKISSFEIYSIAPLEPVKIALASSSSASDVRPAVVKVKPTEEEPVEVAKSGQLGSASDSARVGGINWSAWIILLGLVVFASALATAGYYGYEWLAVSSEARRQSKQRRSEDIDEEIALSENQRDVYQTIKEVAQKLDEPKKELEEKAEEDTPKTRW